MLMWCLQKGYTALILAADKGYIDVVEHLLQHKADLDPKDHVLTVLTDGLSDG